MSGSQANRKKVLESIRTTLGANAPDEWREANVRHRLVTHPSGTIPARSLGNREAGLALFSGMLASQGAEVTRVREVRDVRRLLRLLAAHAAQEVHLASLASALGIPRSTLANHEALLEAVYLLFEIPAWSRNPTARVVRHPKVHFTDTGLAAHLLGVTPASFHRPGSPAAGPLLENFVVSEIARLSTWSDVRTDLHHFRDRDGKEIDLVLESRDGRVAAVEVKAGSTPGSGEFRTMAWLRDRLGGDFVQGVLLYTGDQVLPFGDRLTAAPISALWAE